MLVQYCGNVVQSHALVELTLLASTFVGSSDAVLHCSCANIVWQVFELELVADVAADVGVTTADVAAVDTNCAMPPKLQADEPCDLKAL